MTVKTIQELYYITNSETGIDKNIKMVGVVTGKTPQEVEAMQMDKFNKVCRQIGKHFDLLGRRYFDGKPKKYIHCNGRTYRIEYDITKMNAGQYVEAATFGKDLVGNMDKILATMATPVKRKWFKVVDYERDHRDRAADLEHADFEAAYHVAVFFYTLYRVSMEVTQPYLVQQMVQKGVKKKTAETILTHSLRTLDGYLMPKWSLITREYLLNRFGN